MVRVSRRPLTRSFSGARWGLKLASTPRAARMERAWRLPVVVALIATVPAFYAEMLEAAVPLVATLAYLVAAGVTGVALALTAHHSPSPLRHVLGNPADVALVLGLLVSALLPASRASPLALAIRLGVSLLVLLRMVWAQQHLLTRGGLAYLLLLALGVLALCGAGFWWLEPTVHSIGEGLWLAFTTAATVGYGDIAPTVPASRIFAVFVVLLGFGVLSTVMAAIAAAWVETEERRMEREIMEDLRVQIGDLKDDIRCLSAQVSALSGQVAASAGPHAGPDTSAVPAHEAGGPEGGR
jgi:voltage-gated potassium channel